MSAHVRVCACARVSVCACKYTKHEMSMDVESNAREGNEEGRGANHRGFDAAHKVHFSTPVVACKGQVTKHKNAFKHVKCPRNAKTFTCRTSHVKRDKSHVTCNTTYITCHTSQFIRTPATKPTHTCGPASRSLGELHRSRMHVTNMHRE